jgi:5-dehydro-2-deoxygluconokinase
VERLRAFKAIIYDGYLKALGDGIPSETSPILVDQTYGEAILADARARGLTTCAPVEKSGQPNFDFEY